MNTTIAIVAGEALELHPHKVAFWRDRRILLIADLHLGKVDHFRNRGLPAPLAAAEQNWVRLDHLVKTFSPLSILFLGDLFHSYFNADWQRMVQWRQQYEPIHFILIKGNHDILPDEQYRQAGIQLHDELKVGPFVFSHHPPEVLSGNAFHLAGHVHPCVQLRGNAKQSIFLECFYFEAHWGLLPAFGVFTGHAKITPSKNSQVYLIAGNSVQKADLLAQDLPNVR